MAKRLDAATLGRTALGIVDAEGLQALSMRRLAAELGVDPMAAYRHVAGKEALLEDVVDAVLSEVDLNGLPGAPWDRLESGVRRTYATMLAHPHAAPLLSARQWLSPSGLRIIDWGLGELASAGVAPPDAVRGMNATGLFLIGLAQSAGGHDARDVHAIDLADYTHLAAALAAGGGPAGHDAILDFWLSTLRDRLRR